MVADNLNRRTIKESSQEEDQVKVFHGLTQELVQDNLQLLAMLELNAEQLTYFLEEEILANPFIELDLANQARVSQVDSYIKKQTEQDDQLPHQTQTMLNYVRSQIDLYPEGTVRSIMYLLLDYVDSRGYIPHTLVELSDRLNYDEALIAEALTQIKGLEPTGIGAYDQRESLLIQIGQDEYAPAHAYQVLADYPQELYDQDYSEIAKKTGLDVQKIKHLDNYYATLNAQPAALFDRQAKIHLIPDLSLKSQDQQLSLRYNRQYLPKLSFNQSYYDQMQAESSKDPQLAEFIQPHYQEYVNLLDNLRIRETLLLEVAEEIVGQQIDYLAKRTTQLASLSIKDLARLVGMSPQLVYRIVASKNIELDDVIYPLTDFINVRSVKQRGDVEELDIKDYMRQILAQHPRTLSNEEIVEILANYQIDVSPTIVDNYRKSLDKEA